MFSIVYHPPELPLFFPDTNLSDSVKIVADEDILICGRCRRSFTDVKEFVKHKQVHVTSSNEQPEPPEKQMHALQLVEIPASQFEENLNPSPDMGQKKMTLRSDRGSSIQSDIEELMSRQMAASSQEPQIMAESHSLQDTLSLKHASGVSLGDEMVYAVGGLDPNAQPPHDTPISSSTALDGIVSSQMEAISSFTEPMMTLTTSAHDSSLVGPGISAQAADISGNGTTVSATGNIQITLTPEGGLALAVQSIPSTLQAALQSGFGLNVVATTPSAAVTTEPTAFQLDGTLTAQEPTAMIQEMASPEMVTDTGDQSFPSLFNNGLNCIHRMSVYVSKASLLNFWVLFFFSCLNIFHKVLVFTLYCCILSEEYGFSHGNINGRIAWSCLSLT